MEGKTQKGHSSGSLATDESIGNPSSYLAKSNNSDSVTQEFGSFYIPSDNWSIGKKLTMEGKTQKGHSSSGSPATNESIGNPSSYSAKSSNSDSVTQEFGSFYIPSDNWSVVGNQPADMGGRRNQPLESVFENPGWKSAPTADDILGQRRADKYDLQRSLETLLKEDKSHPCPLTNSIYYGAQDAFFEPPSSSRSSSSAYKSTSNKNKKKASGETKDIDEDYRGHWWKGGVWY